MHDYLFEEIQKAIENGTPDNLAAAAPRGNAKSTIVSFALPIWAAVYKKKHYIVIVSDTASQADDFLVNIRDELEENELLRHDFGDQSGDVWTQSDLITSGDVRIQALGIGKKIRGRRYKQWRPDLIIGDDLENDENVASPDQRKKNLSWYTKALSKAGDERTDKILIGTIIHYDSLLAKTLKNPVYMSKKYQAVIKWSSSPLWGLWEKIITNLENPGRLAEAREYYEQNKSAMLEGTEVLWPEKESYYNLMLQRLADGPAAFSSEKQNEPLSDEDRRFLPEWISYYEDNELTGKELYVVGFVDPSMGKQGSDYSAIVIIAMDSNYQVYVLEADLQRRHPDLIINDSINWFRKYPYMKRFGVEENQFQEYFKDNLVKKVEEVHREENLNVPLIKGVKQVSDKILRIESLQPDIKNGRVKFKRNQQMLIEQLVNFPSADNDDGPDALEGAITLLGKRSGIADFYKAEANDASKPTPKSFLQDPNIQGLITPIHLTTGG